MQALPLPDATSFKYHPLTWFVIALCSVVFIHYKMQGLQGIAAFFAPVHASDLLSPFAPWRLWTPTFVHYTYDHLLTNVYLWWLFASKIERHNRVELLAVCVISAALANACQWWMVDEKFGGLSGLVYALLGYLTVMSRLFSVQRYRVDTALTIVLLALIPLLATGAFGKFSNYAHVVGLGCGVVCAFVSVFASVCVSAARSKR